MTKGLSYAFVVSWICPRQDGEPFGPFDILMGPLLGSDIKTTKAAQIDGP